MKALRFKRGPSKGLVGLARGSITWEDCIFLNNKLGCCITPKTFEDMRFVDLTHDDATAPLLTIKEEQLVHAF